MTADAPQKIIIRTPNWLGDLVMSTGFIRSVMETHPKARVDLVVKKGLDQLPLPMRGEIHVYDEKTTSAMSFGWRLRKQAYDRFYLLPPSFSSAWMAFWSGAKERIGFAGEFRRWLLTKPVHPIKPPRSRHLTEEYEDLLGLSHRGHLPQFDVDAEWGGRHWPTGLELQDKFAVLAPGGIYGPAKKWPIEHFHAVAKTFKADGLQPVVLGTAEDRLAGDEIIRGLVGAVNLCGKTNLNEMVAVLARAALVMSNDSGAMHVAAALGRPQVAIFGSTSPRWTGPLSKQAKVVSLNLSCSPCFKRVCPLGHTNCLKDLSVSDVLAAARTLL